MKYKDTFSSCHPIINVLYFGLMLLFGMCLMHPVCLALSIISAMCYILYLDRKKYVKLFVKYIMPMMLMTGIINPVFNHEGSTILIYLPSGNPLTLESILYGVAAAGMMASVILWFLCFNEIMTSDKLVYLFGRFIPALSMILSMTLRFIPKFIAQMKIVSRTQLFIGREFSNGSFFQRIERYITIISILITWTLETSIETADSMKSRGYGLPGRTAFSIYNFERRDKYLLEWFCFCGFYLICGWAAGSMKFCYYPAVQGVEFNTFIISQLVIYFALGMTPVCLNIKEARKWKHSQYKI